MTSGQTRDVAAAFEVATRVRSFARRLLAEAGDGFTPTLVAVRDARVVAAASHADHVTLLGAAGQLAAGLGADALALVLVGVQPTVPANPATGLSWAPGEAAAALGDGRAAELGWVTESLLVSVVSRGGHRSSTAQAFRAAGGEVAWSEGLLELHAGRADEALGRALSVPAVDPERMPVEPERARVALDIGTTRVIDQRLAAVEPGGRAVLALPDEAAVERHLDEGLLPWQYLVHAAG